MIHKIEFYVADFKQHFHCLPKTHADIIRLAEHAPLGTSEVHILVLAADSDLSPSFELERIELMKNPDSTWRIQLLPEPGPFNAFKDVHSDRQDVHDYLYAVERGERPVPLKAYSFQLLTREGLGPEFRIDTRRDNQFPVFEHDHDLELVLKKFNINQPH